MNKAIPLQASQNPQVPIQKEDMSNIEIRSAIHSLIQVLATQVTRDSRVHVNPNGSTTTSSILDFTRMNHPKLFGSKVEEVPQGFIGKVLKLLDAIGVYSHETA